MAAAEKGETEGGRRYWQRGMDVSPVGGDNTVTCLPAMEDTARHNPPSVLLYRQL